MSPAPGRPAGARVCSRRRPGMPTFKAPLPPAGPSPASPATSATRPSAATAPPPPRESAPGNQRTGLDSLVRGFHLEPALPQDFHPASDSAVCTCWFEIPISARLFRLKAQSSKLPALFDSIRVALRRLALAGSRSLSRPRLFRLKAQSSKLPALFDSHPAATPADAPLARTDSRGEWRRERILKGERPPPSPPCASSRSATPPASTT